MTGCLAHIVDSILLAEVPLSQEAPTVFPRTLSS